MKNLFYLTLLFSSLLCSVTKATSGALPVCQYVKCVQDRIEKNPRYLLNSVFEDEFVLPIHQAVAKFESPINVVRFMANEAPKTLLTPDEHGSLVLHKAVSKPELFPIVDLLIELAPLSVQVAETSTGNLPLHSSIIHEDEISIDVIKLLVTKEPYTTTVKNKFGELPLHIGASTNLLAVVKYLTEATLKQDSLGLKTPTNNGQRPLHRALQGTASLDVVVYLSELDHTTLTSLDRKGNTPLSGILYLENTIEIVKYLVKKAPSSLNIKNNFDQYPIHLFSRGLEQNLPVLQYITELAPEYLLAEDKIGRTPLQTAYNNLSFKYLKRATKIFCKIQKSTLLLDKCAELKKDGWLSEVKK